MIEAGRYKHFKGGQYRVLFLATWFSSIESVKEYEDGDSCVVITAGLRPMVVQSGQFNFDVDDASLLRVTWCGRAPNVLENVVIYCNLEGVFARVESEFEEMVKMECPAHEDCRRARFERIGD